jgi:aminopeptidase YwaD
MLKHLFFSAFLLSVVTNYAQKEYALGIVDSLCSPRFHGRGYVQQGDTKAAQFIVQELKRLNIRSFPDKSYTQGYSFNVNTFPHAVEVILGDKMLKPGEDYLISPMSGPAQGDFDVVEINKHTFFEKFGGDINFRQLDPSQTIFVFDFTDTLNQQLQQQMEGLSYQATQYFPTVWVTKNKMMYSVSRKQSNYPRIEIDSTAYVSTKTISLKINNKYIPKYETQNVIGYIPGKKKKKYIVISAHYDHLGRMGKNAYFPGGNDNASGVAMLLSLAKHFSSITPKYSLVFCFFSGEEAGLLGSKYFVDHPYFSLNKIKMVVNIDIMGGAGDGITVVNATKHPKEFKKLTSINEDWSLIPMVKSRGASANSDHYYFSETRVPAFFIYSNGMVKNYHDIYDTAENTPLTNFDEVQELLSRFIRKL